MSAILKVRGLKGDVLAVPLARLTSFYSWIWSAMDSLPFWQAVCFQCLLGVSMVNKQTIWRAADPLANSACRCSTQYSRAQTERMRGEKHWFFSAVEISYISSLYCSSGLRPGSAQGYLLKQESTTGGETAHLCKRMGRKMYRSVLVIGSESLKRGFLHCSHIC